MQTFFSKSDLEEAINMIEEANTKVVASLTAVLGKNPTGEAVAFTTNQKYYGRLCITRIDNTKSASVTLKNGNTSNSQTTTRVIYFPPQSDECYIEANGVYFSSLTAKNVRIESEVYLVTLEADSGS